MANRDWMLLLQMLEIMMMHGSALDLTYFESRIIKVDLSSFN